MSLVCLDCLSESVPSTGSRLYGRSCRLMYEGLVVITTLSLGCAVHYSLVNCEVRGLTMSKTLPY